MSAPSGGFPAFFETCKKLSGLLVQAPALEEDQVLQQMDAWAELAATKGIATAFTLPPFSPFWSGLLTYPRLLLQFYDKISDVFLLLRESQSRLTDIDVDTELFIARSFRETIRPDVQSDTTIAGKAEERTAASRSFVPPAIRRVVADGLTWRDNVLQAGPDFLRALADWIVPVKPNAAFAFSDAALGDYGDESRGEWDLREGMEILLPPLVCSLARGLVTAQPTLVAPRDLVIGVSDVNHNPIAGLDVRLEVRGIPLDDSVRTNDRGEARVEGFPIELLKDAEGPWIGLKLEDSLNRRSSGFHESSGEHMS